VREAREWWKQRILELREIQEQLQSQLYDVFELMREQNLSEEEQRAVGGIWLNRLCDQLQPLADVQPEDIVVGLWNYRFFWVTKLTTGNFKLS
jgi:hypothetical protein